ncbi:MAG: type 4a pilus biogenesis protein PilO [bacterium]
MNLITPTILIIISLGIFFGYVDPNYRGDLSGGDKSVKALQLEDADYQTALTNSGKIVQQRDVLIAKKNSISDEQLGALQKMLPDNVDNVRLIIDIDGIAQSQNLSIKNIRFDTVGADSASTQVGGDNKKYGTLGMSFSVTASYDAFSMFLTKLEESLRLVDITNLSVSANDNGFNEYTVSMKTYWLK